MVEEKKAVSSKNKQQKHEIVLDLKNAYLKNIFSIDIGENYHKPH